MSWFFIARGEARDIIEAEHEQEKIPSKALESLAKASSATSTSVQVNLHEFLKTLASKTTDPVADWIEIIAAEEIEKEAQGSAKGEESKESKPKKRMRLTDAAVFKNDKLVGCLNRPETRGSIGYSVR